MRFAPYKSRTSRLLCKKEDFVKKHGWILGFLWICVVPVGFSSIDEIINHNLLDKSELIYEIQTYVGTRIAPFTFKNDRGDWSEYAQHLRQRILNEIIFTGKAKEWQDKPVQVE